MRSIETVTWADVVTGTCGGLVRTIAIACMAACAPGAGAADPGVIVIEEKEQTASFIRNFNPLLEVGDVRWPATRAMYEPMLIWNGITGEYVPWLATDHQLDGDRLCLELRAGVRWSDGAPFTARDVVFTFELLRDHPALDLRGVWGFLDRVTALDDDTVEIRFARPFVPGFYYLAQQPIVPEHVWKDVADPVSWTNPHPVATGPFTEVTTFETQVYQVDRNPHYWQDVAVRGIRFLAFPSNDQLAFALIHGDVDWAGSFLPAVDRIFVGKDPAHHGYWFPPVDGGVTLYANTARPPFDDVRVRKAISMAIDRERVVQVGMHDYTRPADATGLNDSYARYRDPGAVAAGDWVRHDPERAARTFDETGRFSVEILVPGGWSDWIRAVQVIARGLREVGIDARMKALDFNAWYEKVQRGEFGLAIGWSEPYPTPYGFYRAMMSSETRKPLGEAAPENWHRFSHPRADELLRALESTTARDEELRLIRELQHLFVEHAPAIPLFPGPLWGEYSTARFTGFPSADDPYAPLSPHLAPQSLLVLTRLEPRSDDR